MHDPVAGGASVLGPSEPVSAVFRTRTALGFADSFACSSSRRTRSAGGLPDARVPRRPRVAHRSHPPITSPSRDGVRLAASIAMRGRGELRIAPVVATPLGPNWLSGPRFFRNWRPPSRAPGSCASAYCGPSRATARRPCGDPRMRERAPDQRLLELLLEAIADRALAARERLRKLADRAPRSSACPASALAALPAAEPPRQVGDSGCAGPAPSP